MSFILSIFMIQGRTLEEWHSYYIKARAHTEKMIRLKLSAIFNMSDQRKRERMLAKKVFDDTRSAWWANRSTRSLFTFASRLVIYIGTDTNLVTKYRELCIRVWCWAWTQSFFWSLRSAPQANIHFYFKTYASGWFILSICHLFEFKEAVSGHVVLLAIASPWDAFNHFLWTILIQPIPT